VLETTYSFFLRSLQNDGGESGYPFGNLSLPVIQRGLGDDYQVRTGDTASNFEMTKKGDSLKRLAETLRYLAFQH
jgi:hypothetical protein